MVSGIRTRPLLCRLVVQGFDQKQRGESEKVPEITTKGLALLLDGESDKAIDAFIEVVRVDPELTELERVLGTCFAAGVNLNERFVCIGIFTIVRIFRMKNVP